MNLFNAFLLSPEIILLLVACVILMVGVFCRKKAADIAFRLAIYGLIAAMFALGFVLVKLNAMTYFAFYYTFIFDKLSVLLKLSILIAMIFTFWYSRYYNQDNGIPANEFYVLSLLATIGMMILVSAVNFITLFLALELMSLPIYAMVALARSRARCIEAAMKYFVTGSVASGMLLYGLSLLFGATHHLDLLLVAQKIALMPITQHPILLFGLVFVIAGIAFKLGAAPFHSWVPDVYDGAPNSVTLLISAAPKLAAFGLAVRFFDLGVFGLHASWDSVLIVIALLSIAIGNVVAIVQTNIKRLLAYSSIAHIGYVLLGLACGTTRGTSAALFYMISYALTSLGAFGMIALLSKTGFEANELSDFSGLNVRQPWLAFLMLLMMFSLAGIPPLVGFIGKVGILEALIKVHSVWLAVVAIIFSIVGAYYYIRVVKVMYFEETTNVERIHCSPKLTIAIGVNALAILWLGVFPSQLFALCHAVFT